jgi:collagenase-like PrtC family protease
MPRKQLELLAPARDAAIGIEAINHGADAVYIGGPAFGARDKAGNPLPRSRRCADTPTAMARASSSRSTPSCATTSWKLPAAWPGTSGAPEPTR